MTNQKTPKDASMTVTEQAGAKNISAVYAPGQSVSIADKRIETANAHDAILWTQIRGEMLRQDTEFEKQQEDLRAKKRKQYIDGGLQGGALIVGAALVVFGNPWIGGFIAAAGLYGIAHDFVMKSFPSFSGQESGGDQ